MLEKIKKILLKSFKSSKVLKVQSFLPFCIWETWKMLHTFLFRWQGSWRKAKDMCQPSNLYIISGYTKRLLMHTKCCFIHCPINYLLTFWVVLVFHLRVGIVFHPTLFTASTWNTKTPFSRMICGSGWTSINLCDSFAASVLDAISALSRNFLNRRPSY